jgi:hypothetical protein
MPSYQEQLQRVVDALRNRQRTGKGPHAGGWGALLEPHAASSIVNTAEAVSVFALAGVLPDDQSLRDGLTYLREKVALHPSPIGSHADARGNKARYAAFGLMGLTAYSQAIEDDGHAEAIATCVAWLQSNGLDEQLDVEDFGQGWSEHPHRGEVSVLSTSIAARALDRVPVGTPDAEESRKLASDARHRLRTLARGDRRKRWWPARANVDESIGGKAAGAAVTALAVMALAEGGTLSQEYARGGIRWLLENTDRWQQEREPEPNIHDANWVHASCPLCLCAVLAPCAGVDPQHPELAAAITYLDQLWSQSAGEWLHGHPAAEVSTSADLYAAHAIRAMRRSWRGFDPVKHLLEGRRRGLRPSVFGGDKPHDVRWVNGTLTIQSADGTLLVSRPFGKRATAMRALLDAFTARWAKVGDHGTYEKRSLSTTQLKQLASVNDVYEYVRRLNKAVGEASIEQRGRSCVIVERIAGGNGTQHDSYVLLGRRLLLA